MESTAIQPIFDRDGYIALPVFINNHRAAEALREVERFIRSRVRDMPPENVIYEDPSRPDSLTMLQQLHRFDEYFKGLINDYAFRLVAETVLKGPVLPANVFYFSKPPGANRATPPHQDAAYFEISPPDAVELWLSLDETDEDTGCLWYVRGSHVQGLMEHKPCDAPGFSQTLADPSPCDDDRTMVACHTRPGDLLVHHALTIHWANQNESNHRQRRALGFAYYRHRPEQEAEAPQGSPPPGGGGAPGGPAAGGPAPGGGGAPSGPAAGGPAPGGGGDLGNI